MTNTLFTRSIPDSPQLILSSIYIVLPAIYISLLLIYIFPSPKYINGGEKCIFLWKNYIDFSFPQLKWRSFWRNPEAASPAFRLNHVRPVRRFAVSAHFGTHQLMDEQPFTARGTAMFLASAAALEWRLRGDTNEQNATAIGGGVLA